MRLDWSPNTTSQSRLHLLRSEQGLSTVLCLCVLAGKQHKQGQEEADKLQM